MRKLTINIENLSVSPIDNQVYMKTFQNAQKEFSIIESFLNQDIYDLMDIPEIFIGKGFEGTYNKYNDLTSMHNDFLEVTYSLGIVGLILLINFILKLFKKTFLLIKYVSDLSISYMSLLFLFLFFGIIGCNFHYFYLSAPLFLSLGALEAMSYHNYLENE